MRIAVIGATGVLGRHLVPRLIERGHAVCATARKEADLDRLKRLGAEAVPADIRARQAQIFDAARMLEVMQPRRERRIGGAADNLGQSKERHPLPGSSPRGLRRPGGPRRSPQPQPLRRSFWLTILPSL